MMSSCVHYPSKTSVTDSLHKEWNKTIPGNFSGQSEAVFDSLGIGSFLKKYPGFKIYTGEINSFYKKRNYAYAWFEKGSLIEQAGNLENRVLNLQNEGVYQKPPYQKELDSLVNNLNTRAKQPDIQVELMLTAQYFAFSKLVWQGMDSTASSSARWYLPRKKVNYAQYLDSLIKMPSKQAAAAEPVYRQYELLRSYLRKYYLLNERDKWSNITLTGKVFKPGDTAAVIATVKKRLYLLEDFKGDTLDRAYNADLDTAILQFQSRNGLLANGLLNKETVAEMNVPLKKRIQQILVNMERCRWLPISLNSDYLAVNIPEFKLHVFHADSLLWSCNVVVGQTMHQTTVFYGDVKYVVFSPYWNVPPSIVQKEVVPEMKRHRDYLSTHRMQITGYADGLPTIRQLPGPENSLGLVKFLFPNSYNIYLHDTPSKSLFGESARAFSHGCIRVQNPTKLANFLLKDQKNWDAQKIDVAMHAGKEQYVTLQNKVPVFIAYFTAFTDGNNKLNFRKDIYNLDDHLASMLIAEKTSY
ncbi:L,D-transpeptidase family protein [Mucilaginibacter paludis]|nr:L,D-transpeptidase family protein [Mucilaginibacter paludis]